MKRLILDQQTLQRIIEEHAENGLSPASIIEKLGLNASAYQVRRILKNALGDDYSYKNKKIDTDSLLAKIEKETFIEYYKSNSREDTLAHFGISVAEFNCLKEFFDFEKSKDDILKVRKATTEERYGVENVFQADWVKQKSKETCIEKYGFEFATQSKEIREKTKETIQKEYGSSEAFYEMVSEKARQTQVERYGVEYFSSTDAYKEKVKKTCQQKFGFDSASQSPDIKEKKRNTCLARYGVPYACMAEDVKERRAASCKQKYGVESPLESKEVQDKARNTVREKYGVDNPSRIDFVREKLSSSSKKTNFDRWLGTYTKEYAEMYDDEDKSREFLSSHDKMTYRELAERFDCPISSALYWINRYSLNQYVKSEKSHYEDEIIQFIGEDVCKKNDRSALSGSEIDIYVDKFRIGIEFNGTYWHSDKNVEKDYHKKKSLLAQEKGIRLIHIYQYEWDDPEKQDKIKMLLDIALHRACVERIYARNCEVRKISNAEARPFNQKNHLQGHRNAQVTYGLFNSGKLVQLMSFSFDKKHNWWEIIRGCPGSNNIVVGGVGRLFKTFIKDYDPEKIFSYCDFNKFDGISYEKIGMKCIGYTSPDKKYVIDGVVYNRNPKKYHEYKDNSECVIWGAGSKKYLWEKSE